MPKTGSKNRAHRTRNPVRQRVFSLNGAAVYLGRGPDSLRELIYAREFPVIQIGERSKIFIDKHDLDTWIEAKKGFM